MSNVNVSELPAVAEADYNPAEAVTLTDLAEAHSVTRLTANKRLEKAGVDPVAKLQTGRAGRPPALFPRSAADTALASTRKASSDTVAQAAAEALAE